MNQFLSNINWFKVLLYASLFFLGYYLYQADYLQIPKLYSVTQLVLSFVFLFAGFIVMSDCWRLVLKEDGIIRISFKEGVVSSGLSVFMKYIPGKLLVVLGRAAYIHNLYHISMTKLSLASLKVQILSIWIGLIIGSVTILKMQPEPHIIFLVVFFIVAFSILLYSELFKRLVNAVFKWITSKNIDYPVLKLRHSPRIIPVFVLNWVLWCIGFYLMVDALTDSAVSMAIGWGFALAGTLAIVALIAPGGLGVREGILTALLIGFGIDKTDAITISIASRLWFLIGELFIFLLALFFSRTNHSKV